MFIKFIEELKNTLKIDLPGFVSHKKMIPQNRKYVLPKNPERQSAVNIVIFIEENIKKIILIKKAQDLHNYSGQMALPGGRKDKTDENLWFTAKRETLEEVGITINDNNFIGALSPLYIPVSNYNVQPYISFIEQKPILNIDTKEVEKVFCVDIYDLLNEKNICYQNNTSDTFGFPYFEVEKQKVWGATAMILSEFLDIYTNLKME
jgi:8-oxo-dGTP pyrophosphatase MutT (NUDIX family)